MNDEEIEKIWNKHYKQGLMPTIETEQVGTKKATASFLEFLSFFPSVTAVASIILIFNGQGQENYFYLLISVYGVYILQKFAGINHKKALELKRHILKEHNLLH